MTINRTAGTGSSALPLLHQLIGEVRVPQAPICSLLRRELAMQRFRKLKALMFRSAALHRMMWWVPLSEGWDARWRKVCFVAPAV